MPKKRTVSQKYARKAATAVCEGKRSKFFSRARVKE